MRTSNLEHWTLQSCLAVLIVWHFECKVENLIPCAASILAMLIVVEAVRR